MILSGANIKRILIDAFLLFRKKWVYHTLFWLLMLLVLVELGNRNLNTGFRLILESVNIFFYIVITYINLLYLIPNFLSGKKKEWLFIGSLLLVCAVVTPLKVITLYFLHSNFPQIQTELIKNQLWYFLGLVYIAGFSTIYSIISEWKEQEKQRAELQNQTVASELRFLKTQINPHFLFNTLNSLYALSMKKSDDAPEVVLRLSEMMRYMLYECNEPQVPLAKEVSYIENYLSLEKLRLPESIDLQFRVSGDITNLQIAPLLFIPLIENSFKHGVANQIGKGFVHIELISDDKELRFYVENSFAKKGYSPEREQQKNGGIGLSNVQRRLDLLYPGKNTLKIEDVADTFKVCLSIFS